MIRTVCVTFGTGVSRGNPIVRVQHCLFEPSSSPLQKIRKGKGSSSKATIYMKARGGFND